MKNAEKRIPSLYFCLFLIFISALITRAWIAYGVSYLPDEGQFVGASLLKSFFEFSHYRLTYAGQDHPILTYYIAFLWGHISKHPEVMRLCPVFFSSLSVLVIGYFSKKITRSSSVSVMTALLAAFSPLAFRYGYYFAPYFLLSLLAPISYFLFLKHMLEQKYDTGYLHLFINLLLINTHFYAFFIVLSQMLILFVYCFKDRKYVEAKKNFVVGCVYIAACIFSAYQNLNPNLARLQQKFLIKTPGLLHSLLPSFSFEWLHQLIVIISMTVILGVTWVKCRDIITKKILFVSFLYVFFTLLFVKISSLLMWRVYGAERYLLILFPVVPFLISVGLNSFSKISARVVLFVLLFAVFITDIQKTQPVEDFDFDASTDQVSKLAKNENAPILLTSYAFGFYKTTLVYYLLFKEINIEPDDLKIYIGDPSGSSELLKRLNKNEHQKVIIHVYEWGEENLDRMDRQIHDIFDEKFKFLSFDVFKGIRVYEMEPL